MELYGPKSEYRVLYNELYPTDKDYMEMIFKPRHASMILVLQKYN